MTSWANTETQDLASEPPLERPRVQLEQTERQSGGVRLFAIRLISFITNYLVAHVPSFTLRHAWYRRILGIELDRGAGVHAGCFFWYYSPRRVRADGIRIGAHSRINRRCTLDLRGGLELGENVSVSPEVVILTAGHQMADPGFRVELKRVLIDDYVWIGTRAMIMPGVTLGRGCVVAAGAVVTRDVPPLAVVAGIPAREVARRPESALAYTLDGPLPLFE
jgi:acetyltransferase-like isoleucine patch superfamily enzyme